jgi:hypothetical protein
MKYPAMPRCCRFFVSPRREEGAYAQAVCNRRATQERRKSGATRRERTLWAVWQRCSLLIPPLRDGHTRHWRLAFQPKAFSRDMAGYFNRLLK